MSPEPSHADIQTAFHAALWQGDPPAGIRAPDPQDSALRFAVYRNNVQHSLSRALAAGFPVIERLVGAPFFAALARAFAAEAPPASPVLLHWGGAFPDFLDAFPPIAHLPFLGDVARLELARGRACHAADAPPLAPAALAGPAPEALRLVLHPSVTLFASRHPAVRIWRAHQPDPPPGPLGAGPDHALIARRPDFEVVVARIIPDTFAVLAALHAGQPLGQAAAHADPTEALALLLRHGLVIDTATTPGETP